MMIRLALISDLEDIYTITRLTIKSVYPKYYPSGAVDLYLDYHCYANIEKDIKKKLVYVAEEVGIAVGTVTIQKNDISRLYVLPSEQGRGYGTQLLDFAEQLISEKYDKAVLDCSLPAKSMYLKRGYKEVSYNILKAENGDFLCYDGMEKKV